MILHHLSEIQNVPFALLCVVIPYSISGEGIRSMVGYSGAVNRKRQATRKAYLTHRVIESILLLRLGKCTQRELPYGAKFD
jgi:hypothetical protein